MTPKIKKNTPVGTADVETVVGIFDKKMNRQLMQYMDICVRCAICKDACHQYVSTGDIKYLPAKRAELLRKIYRKYFTKAGEFIPVLFEAEAPSDMLFDQLFDSMYACTGCRRCMYYCPFSIDTTWIMSMSKALLVAAGRGDKLLGELADAAILKGDQPELFEPGVVMALEGTEAKLKEILGDPEYVIPRKKKGARVLYAALSGEHTILPAAQIFEKAGEDWSLSMFEAANYGFFLGDAGKATAIAKRIVDEAVELGVEEVVVTECGHAFRVMNSFYAAWSGAELPFEVSTILDVIDRYMQQGHIQLDPAVHPMPITYHDPCQFGRNSGVYEPPRNILRALAPDFRELDPNREKNWCCGGGGGLVAIPEMTELRMKSGKKKVEQVEATGAKVIASPCENCRLQLEDLSERYEMGLQVRSVMDLVVEAMITD